MTILKDSIEVYYIEKLEKCLGIYGILYIDNLHFVSPGTFA